ncbi:MAG TPA: hypothetical protein VGP79_00905 [Bryobacteraceae bacterium]|jgi:hypothetical protein|nr:hypothetical protein [Bryobacteraceae bacterium]
MGQETNCKARFDKQVSDGHAMLETDYVLFRGDFRVKIPFKSIRKVKATGDWLKIDSAEGALELDLGPAAASKWEQKILHPPSRLDKIGVKPGHKVVILGVSDTTLAGELTERGATIVKRAGPGTDIVFFGAGKMLDLDRLESLKIAIHPAGAVWIVYPKGVKAITQNDVMAATKAAGLVDTKVCAFSATHTALKAVIPVANRKS